MDKPAIDINEATIKNFVETLRPTDPEIRKKLDVGYSYDGKVAMLYEIRPVWNDPEKIQNIEFAKISINKTQMEWSLYWKRASGKWESYSAFPKSTRLDQILQAIKDDPHGCFFG